MTKPASKSKVRPLRSVAAQMMLLFPSTTKGHAHFTPGSEKLREDGKVEVDYHNHDGALVTEQMWDRHLAGEYPLVIGLACDDGTTCVAVADLDIYGMDIRGFVRAVAESGLPLHVRKSKSGSHLVAFTPPTNVRDANLLAKGMVWKLGLLDELQRINANRKKVGEKPFRIEYFPKPVKGNKQPAGLNMPYLGGQYAGKTGFLRPDMTEIPIEEFLASVQRLTQEQIDELLACGREAEKEEPKKGSGDASERAPRYAAAMLRTYARELENLGVGERNEPLRDKAYHMGTMICAGWIERQKVEDTLLAAISRWDEKAPDDLRRHLDAGSKVAHDPLPDLGSLTEDDVARQFAEENAEKLRFDWTIRKWFRFIPGSHWKQLDTPEAFHAARIKIRALYAALTSEKEKAKAKGTARVAFAAAVEKFAAADSDAGIPVTQDAWNTNPMLLGTPGGTVDLATVEMRPANPGDMISKITSIAPAETADCPTWLHHVGSITLGDGEYARFLQKAMGYTMLGDNREELMFFLFGTGGNGKGKFIDTMAKVMGDYHYEAPLGMFTATKFAKPTNDIADARGSRILTSNENASDTFWDEEMIKQMTGGSKMTARKLYANNSTFKMEATPWFLANGQPRLKNVDDAIKRRLIMLPFNLKIITKPEEFDPTNPAHVMKDVDWPEKLMAEAPGILRWMLDGLKMYWEDKDKTGLGLRLPGVVKRATDDFLYFEDNKGQFLEFFFERTGNENDRVDASEVYSTWLHYCQQNNEEPGAQKEFTKALLSRGFEKKIKDGYNVFIKLKKRVTAKPEQPGMI